MRSFIWRAAVAIALSSPTSTDQGAVVGANATRRMLPGEGS